MRPPGRTLPLFALTLFFCNLALAWPLGRDLGPGSRSGRDAFQGINQRAFRVLTEMACGDEGRFLNATRGNPKNPGNSPDDPLYQYLKAKAAVLGWGDSDCQATEEVNLDEWTASFEVDDRNWQNHSLLGEWRSLVQAQRDLNKDLQLGIEVAEVKVRADALAPRIQSALSMLESRWFVGFEWFTGQCSAMIRATDARLVDPAPGANPATLTIAFDAQYHLTDACLEQQIAKVILADNIGRHGQNPGTNGLKCGLVFTGPSGDWDMAVEHWTRFAYLFHRIESNIGPAGRAAMEKVRTRLLTLSGPPAAEVHSLYACGNPDNRFGSARDRLDDTDYYDPDLKKTVEGKDGNGGTDLAGLAALLALLAIAAVLVVAAGAAISFAVGPMPTLVVTAGVLVVALGGLQYFSGALFGGIEESENHLLMQNSSKYLTNQLLREELIDAKDDDGVRQYDEFNDEIRQWFMKKLQDVARDDFQEYNAKPYGRLSVTSLLNLYDFTCESRLGKTICEDGNSTLATAAGAVLDLTAAKAAVGSIQSLRIVPHRRLAAVNTDYEFGELQEDGTRAGISNLSDISSGADHMIAALQFWTGNTNHGPDGHANEDAVNEMVWHATSRYRPDPLILDIATDKSTQYTQTFRHRGWERYSSGPGWLLTAGGTTTGFAQGFRAPPFGVIFPPIIKDNDHGAGVPTTLIPRLALKPDPREDRYPDFLRFEGHLKRWARDKQAEPLSFEGNFCVFGSFACGINMQIPSFLEKCLTTFGDVSQPSGSNFQIIDSGKCPAWNDDDDTDDFYTVVYEQPCRPAMGCEKPNKWGFIEVVSKRAWTGMDGLAGYVKSRNAANFVAMLHSSSGETLRYLSAANGDIAFDPAASLVTALNGSASSTANPPNWPRASGDIINRVGDAHYTIKSPRQTQVYEVDFGIQEKPRRVPPR